jgi:hypothetical protein
MDSLEEMQSFLNVDARLDLKAVALQYVLGKCHLRSTCLFQYDPFIIWHVSKLFQV